MGRNISVIIPPPFDARHNTYVRNYVASGEQQNTPQKFCAWQFAWFHATVAVAQWFSR